MLGSTVGLFSTAGAGALGAKLLGGKSQAAQNASPGQEPQAYPSIQ
jgi:hypothetical protein